MTISVNEEIQDRTIRHMVYLERYKASEVKKILKELNTVILPEITTKIQKRLDAILERGTDMGPQTTARLVQLEKELSKLARDMATSLGAQIVPDIDALSEHEIDWQANVIKDAVDFDIDLVIPSPRAVAKIVLKTSFAGLTLDDWFDNLTRSTQKNVMIAVNRGIVEGETTEQIIRRIRGTRALGYTDGVWQTTRNQAATIARSTINHVSNQSRLEFFKDNEDIIKGLKWIATLDSRTSLTCASLDGKVFPLDKGPRPPAHPNCRSTMTAVLKDVDDMGIDDIPPAMRESINGQVPGSTTYGEWLKKQPPSVQDEVLGVTKGALFRDGKLPIERFVGESLKPLNLNQLRKLEKNSFKKAGL